MPDDPNQNPTPDPAPNNTVPTPQTDIEELKKLFQGTLSEMNTRARNAEARNRELEDENLKIKNANSTPPSSVPPEVSADSFWKDPVNTINTLIQRQVAPLTQVAQISQNQLVYNQLKAQYRGYPGFPSIESTVDEFMQGQEPNHNNIKIAIQRAVGHLAMTDPSKLIQNNTPTPQDPPTPPVSDPKVIPIRQPDSQAHLRPTVNNSTPSDTQPPKRQYTEQERRLMRELNQTEEQYDHYMNGSPQVGSWVKKERK